MPPTAVRVATLLSLGLALAACTASGGEARRWASPAGVSQSELEADSRQCKRLADEHAMRGVVAPGQMGPDSGAFGGSPLMQTDRAEARETFRRYYSACMEALGYTPK